jgi:hypothetical protein
MMNLSSAEGHMNYDALPQFVLAKLLGLEEAVAALSARAGAIEADIEDRRARRYGNARRADDNPRLLEAELQRFLADQKVLQTRLQAEQAVLSACKVFLDRLPAGSKLESVPVTGDGHDLAGIRKRINAANAERDALRRVPAPSEDIEARVWGYLRGLTPKVRGIGPGERLSIIWPGAQTPTRYIAETTCDPLALLAALFPDRMLSLVMTEVERMANDPLPVAQRPPRIAALERDLFPLTASTIAPASAPPLPRASADKQSGRAPIASRRGKAFDHSRPSRQSFIKCRKRGDKRLLNARDKNMGSSFTHSHNGSSDITAYLVQKSGWTSTYGISVILNGSNRCRMM